MKASEFITEGTELVIQDESRDGFVFAKRTSLGRGNGTALRMFITKDEWEDIKHMQANLETGGYDLATAEMLVKDLIAKGSQLVWKTAADFNADAREMENHRFAKDMPDAFQAIADKSRNQAKAVAKSSIKPIK